MLQKTALGLSLIFLFVACETGYKGELPSSNASSNSSTEVNSSFADEHTFQYKEPSLEPQVFEGGYLSDGLDISKIRQSQHGNMLRLVFDSKGASDNVSSNKVGSYSFIYYPDKYLITATIGGYRHFSASLPTFSTNSVVEKMYMDEYLDDSGYKFHIKLREDAKVKVFDLENPARIVVDIVL